MKALLIKDFLNVKAQGKAILLVLAVWFIISVINGSGSFFAVLSVVYAILLPLTSVTADDKCGFERYAMTMELVSGELEDGDEIFQWYIIADPHFLIHHTDELVFYDSELDLYVWGVTHFGTSWDYVDAPEIIMDKKVWEDEE